MVKPGDLVKIDDAPEYGYGLVISYNENSKIFEIRFSDEGEDAIYYCTFNDPNVVLVSGIEN